MKLNWLRYMQKFVSNNEIKFVEIHAKFGRLLKFRDLLNRFENLKTI